MGRVECTDAGVTLAEQGPQVEDQFLRHRPRLKKPPSGGSNFGAASASPPSRFERLTSLKPPALPGDIYLKAAKAICDAPLRLDPQRVVEELPGGRFPSGSPVGPKAARNIPGAELSGKVTNL